MNNSVWFFGDSFCAANEEGDVPIKGVGCQTIPDYWWGVEFANSLGKEINIYLSQYLRCLVRLFIE